MASADEIITAQTGTPAQWAGLSQHLIARIFPCDARGIEVQDGGSVRGPITDANIEATANWQSPFENTGPESRLPQLMSLIQSGQLGVLVNAVQVAGYANKDGTLAKDVAEVTKTASKDLEGRTGMTKLNARQIYSGAAPIKLSATLHFRAFADPETEVLGPYKRLLEWSLPKKLAEDGFLSNAIASSPSNIKELMMAMFPSEAPQLVGFSYGINRWSPMVIEHVAHPIDGPIDAYGRPLYRAVQISLATLTALDKNDVVNLFTKG